MTRTEGYRIIHNTLLLGLWNRQGSGLQSQNTPCPGLSSGHASDALDKMATYKACLNLWKGIVESCKEKDGFFSFMGALNQETMDDVFNRSKEYVCKELGLGEIPRLGECLDNLDGNQLYYLVASFLVLKNGTEEQRSLIPLLAPVPMKNYLDATEDLKGNDAEDGVKFDFLERLFQFNGIPYDYPYSLALENTRNAQKGNPCVSLVFPEIDALLNRLQSDLWEAYKGASLAVLTSEYDFGGVFKWEGEEELRFISKENRELRNKVSELEAYMTEGFLNRGWENDPLARLCNIGHLLNRYQPRERDGLMEYFISPRFVDLSQASQCLGYPVSWKFLSNFGRIVDDKDGLKLPLDNNEIKHKVESNGRSIKNPKK